jgi:prolipoprotein diacylglyceryltransferase
VFLAFLGLYSVVRFAVEFYREVDLRIGAFTAAQVGSVALALVALVVWLWMQRRPVAVSLQQETPGATDLPLHPGEPGRPPASSSPPE